MNSANINIGDNIIEFWSNTVSEELFYKALNSPKLSAWLNEKYQPNNVEIHRFQFLDVAMFGPTNVGFIYAKIEWTNLRENKKSFPSYVLIRGNACAVLTRVTIAETNEKHFLFVNQVKIPCGGYCSEICAGMIDNASNVVGEVFKEIKQELDITLNKDQLHYLGEYFPSQGGCDEKIICYFAEALISAEKFEELKRKTTGEHDEGEYIHITTCNEADLLQTVLNTQDSKAICCYTYYQKWLSDKNK